MDEVLLEIFTIVNVIENESSETPYSQNESVANAYPKLCTVRWEFIPFDGNLIHLKISDVLSDAEVKKICESLSVQTLHTLIMQKLKLR